MFTDSNGDITMNPTVQVISDNERYPEGNFVVSTVKLTTVINRVWRLSFFLPTFSSLPLIHDMTDKKFKEVYHEAMTEIYKASIPSASWDDLLRDSPRNEAGQILIPYEDYHISDQILDEIIETTAKKHRLNQFELQSLRSNVYLGPSPISIRPKS